MSDKRHEEEEHVNHERWLLSYADFITLLLIFFIVMYSISSLNVSKFEALKDEMANAFGNGSIMPNQGEGIMPGSDSVKDNPGSQDNAEGEVTTDNLGEVGAEQGADVDGVTTEAITTENTTDVTSDSQAEIFNQALSDLQATQDQIVALVDQYGLTASVSVMMEERGSVISFGESLLFAKGSAEINTGAVELLTKMAEIMSTTNNYIRVEGFTDDLPINTQQFPSNWELAAQRAINVTKYLINGSLQAERLSAMSYGEYRPEVDNTNEENRQKNRRVNIVILSSKYDTLEPTSTIDATPAP